MATVDVNSGLSDKKLPDNQVIFIGFGSRISQLKYEDFEKKIGNVVSKDLFESARAKGADATVPVYLNSCYLVPLPSKCSHYNSLSQSSTITKQLRTLTGAQPNVCVILAVDYVHLFASVAAAARVFPLYSAKSKAKENEPKNVSLELLMADGQPTITESDLTCLRALVSAVRNTARLVDSPANVLHTDAFVQDALTVAEALGDTVKTSVIKGDDLQKQGFGGIYNVGKCSLHPPAFVILSHRPQGATETFAIVGKGIVFDTGGMQLKTKAGMPSMKRDMGGAAAMLNAFDCLVRSGFKQNLHCCLCFAENMIGPMANRPDDVITMLSGHTVEINNTDAEGRLVLADGVYYAHSVLKASVIIDMATLTGAQRSATGATHAALVCNNQDWEHRVCSSGRKSGELVHPLPYAPELHFPDLASSIADMKNSNLGKMQGPPSAVASLFIHAQIGFDPDVVWIHVDMASQVESGERGTGWGPALITQLIGKGRCGVGVIDTEK